MAARCGASRDVGRYRRVRLCGKGDPHDGAGSRVLAMVAGRAERAQAGLVILAAGPRSTQPQGAGRRGSEPLWRAIAVFRFASLGYAVLLVAVIDRTAYSRPAWAWAVIAVMTAWTAATTIAYARPDHRTPLLSADLAVTAGFLLSTEVLQYPHAIRHDVMPV